MFWASLTIWYSSRFVIFVVTFSIQHQFNSHCWVSTSFFLLLLLCLTRQPLMHVLLRCCWIIVGRIALYSRSSYNFFHFFLSLQMYFFFGLNLHSKLTDLMFRKKQLKVFLNALCWRLVHFETRRSTQTKKILAKETRGLTTFLLAEKNPQFVLKVA